MWCSKSQSSHLDRKWLIIIPWSDVVTNCSGTLYNQKMLSIITIIYYCAKSFQLCLTFHDPMDSSVPDSSVHGILQARILEWVAIPFSRKSTQELSWVLLHGRRILYHWATREVHLLLLLLLLLTYWASTLNKGFADNGRCMFMILREISSLYVTLCMHMLLCMCQQLFINHNWILRASVWNRYYLNLHFRDCKVYTQLSVQGPEKPG